jgi:hypothetical protein
VRDDETCAICGRTILAGERTRIYLSSKHGALTVCALCVNEAERRGWIDEAAQTAAEEVADPPEEATPLPVEETPVPVEDAPGPLAAAPKPPPAGEGPAAVGEQPSSMAEGTPETEERPDPAAPGANVGRSPYPEAPESPQTRLERAAAQFNASDACRTVGGLMRTLGPPWVSIGAAAGSPSEVRITIAWELSWYQWGVDIGAEPGTIRQLDKGSEIDELDGSARQWNATAAPGGFLELGAGDPHRDADADRAP